MRPMRKDHTSPESWEENMAQDAYNNSESQHLEKTYSLESGTLGGESQMDRNFWLMF